MSMAASQPVSNITPRLIIVMGVSGAGKTTIARDLASALNAPFLDADDYHPEENIKKMSNGIALTDNDRFPWLKYFSERLSEQKGIAVGACSSLKKSYRNCITLSAKEPVLFIYMNGSKELISNRMKARKNHFMPSDLLESQFNTLEKPSRNELAYTIDINPSPEDIIQSILLKLV